MAREKHGTPLLRLELCVPAAAATTLATYDGAILVRSQRYNLYSLGPCRLSYHLQQTATHTIAAHMTWSAD